MFSARQKRECANGGSSDPPSSANHVHESAGCHLRSRVRNHDPLVLCHRENYKHADLVIWKTGNVIEIDARFPALKYYLLAALPIDLTLPIASVPCSTRYRVSTRSGRVRLSHSPRHIHIAYPHTDLNTGSKTTIHYERIWCAGTSIAMDLSDARSSDAEENGESSSRRKSGRAIRKPQLFSQDVNLITNIPEKRKRPVAKEDEEENDDEEDAEESESEDEPEDDDTDEEEERERRRAARRAATRKKQSGKSNSKPAPSRAAKKAKTSSAGKSLAIRPAANGKTKKAAPKRRTAPPRPIFHATTEGIFGKELVQFFKGACLITLVMLTSMH